MTNSLCGIDCSKCEMNKICGGCSETNGRPFGNDCMIAVCCQKRGNESCASCADIPCNLRAQIIAQFNGLGIEDMEKITELYALKGSFVNIEYTLPSGQMMKVWDDNKIYLGNQVHKKNSERCYGLAADERYLMVSEYGDNGTEAEIVLFKRWR